MAAMVAEMVAMDPMRAAVWIGVLRLRDVLASYARRCPQRRSWLPSIEMQRLLPQAGTEELTAMGSAAPSDRGCCTQMLRCDAIGIAMAPVPPCAYAKLTRMDDCRAGSS